MRQLPVYLEVRVSNAIARDLYKLVAMKHCKFIQSITTLKYPHSQTPPQLLSCIMSIQNTGEVTENKISPQALDSVYTQLALPDRIPN